MPLFTGLKIIVLRFIGLTLTYCRFGLVFPPTIYSNSLSFLPSFFTAFFPPSLSQLLPLSICPYTLLQVHIYSHPHITTHTHLLLLLTPSNWQWSICSLQGKVSPCTWGPGLWKHWQGPIPCVLYICVIPLNPGLEDSRSTVSSQHCSQARSTSWLLSNMRQECAGHCIFPVLQSCDLVWANFLREML